MVHLRYIIDISEDRCDGCQMICAVIVIGCVVLFDPSQLTWKFEL